MAVLKTTTNYSKSPISSSSKQSIFPWTLLFMFMNHIFIMDIWFNKYKTKFAARTQYISWSFVQLSYSNDISNTFVLLWLCLTSNLGHLFTNLGVNFKIFCNTSINANSFTLCQVSLVIFGRDTLLMTSISDTMRSLIPNLINPSHPQMSTHPLNKSVNNSSCCSAIAMFWGLIVCCCCCCWRPPPPKKDIIKD